MYKISELAKKVGLSRTALLYYEKQNLIKGQRLDNGYRVYSEQDLQRILLIQQLQLGGLTLKECKQCLEAKLDKGLLYKRLDALNVEIAQKQQARSFLQALVGEGELKPWHEKLNAVAPEAHIDWLKTQGFDEKEALRLKWLSKNMNEHDSYMNDFMSIFSTLEYWGPGSKSDTKKAFNIISPSPKKILEMGCGKGLATLTLATESEAQITAIDNEQSALDALTNRFSSEGLSERLITVCASMSDIPFSSESFDLIWAEGSAYIIGVEKALSLWKPVLKPSGHFVFSDMVWYTDEPSEEAETFWHQEYPDMQQIGTRVKQIENAGYRVLKHFNQSKESWNNYYQPLSKRLDEVRPTMEKSPAFNDIEQEVNICTQYADEFGYHMFVVEKA